ncbi:MAG: glycosyltransferase 87 family protein [Verrucomicrobiota bacterium]|nr:glycosyltransferase 87 family protein [Verrucomicrobiota bacterium]
MEPFRNSSPCANKSKMLLPPLTMDDKGDISGETRPPSSKPPVSWNRWIIAAAALALVLKCTIALNTSGTNDVYFFRHFGQAIAEQGLEWTYRYQPMFNHPPLVAYALRGLYTLSNIPSLRDNGISFPFLLRLPGIVADFAVMLLLLGLRERLKLPASSLLLLALSPVSLMVSGFHGNTDPVLVLCIVGAAYLAVLGRPLLCGLTLALACDVKIIPLLLLPAFLFFWFRRQHTFRFVVAFAAALLITWIQPLLTCPAAFARNVLGYGSYWGLWGVTYWFRLTGWSGFGVLGYTGLPWSETVVMTVMKCVILVAAVWLAWRAGRMDGRQLFIVIGCTWLVFFVFAPGIGPQYLVWLMPFLLVFAPVRFATVTLASTCFLFVFYNTIAAGLPWNLAISKDNLIPLWGPWTIWPWLAFIVALRAGWHEVMAGAGVTAKPMPLSERHFER